MSIPLIWKKNFKLQTQHIPYINYFISEHTCSIIASLLRHLTGSNRGRLIQKFVEDDHVKVSDSLLYVSQDNI